MTAAEAGTSVVQEFVPPRRCRLAMIADGADEPHDVDVAPVFGPLLFRGRPAGMSPSRSLSVASSQPTASMAISPVAQAWWVIVNVTA